MVSCVVWVVLVGSVTSRAYSTTRYSTYFFVAGDGTVVVDVDVGDDDDDDDDDDDASNVLAEDDDTRGLGKEEVETADEDRDDAPSDDDVSTSMRTFQHF
jgi:hypothetical protein